MFAIGDCTSIDQRKIKVGEFNNCLVIPLELE